MKLNHQKEELKDNLTLLLNHINKTITENYQVLYKEKPDPEIIYELHKQIEFKKKEYKISKNMNNSIKTQYNSIINKFNKKTENGNSVEENAVLLNNLKTENKKLKVRIRKYKDNLTFQNKDEKNEPKTSDFPNIVKMKSDEIRGLTVQKHEYFNKINIDNV